MDKRYQVFVSSTYVDLKVERQHVVQMLLSLDCIPSGMELFPAVDEEQLDFIKKIIDDCDYYILIVAGRYGSTNEAGISYTEMEYNYAIERGKKVLAFLHECPDDLLEEKAEVDAEKQTSLERFRAEVSGQRLVQFWKTPEELSMKIAVSLPKTMKAHPAVGWIRADRVSSEEALSDINSLSKENLRLKEELEAQAGRNDAASLNLAGLDEIIRMSGKYYRQGEHHRQQEWVVEPAWQELFAFIAPKLLTSPSEDAIETILKNAIFKASGVNGRLISWDDDFQIIKVQLLALGLVNVRYLKTVGGGMAHFWTLTPKGKTLMYQVCTVKSEREPVEEA